MRNRTPRGINERINGDIVLIGDWPTDSRSRASFLYVTAGGLACIRCVEGVDAHNTNFLKKVGYVVFRLQHDFVDARNTGRWACCRGDHDYRVSRDNS